LEVLELAHNRIKEIDATAFNKLTNLKYLDLSYNEFTQWTQINPRMLLQSLVKLKTLKLSNNNLKTFTGKDSQMLIESSSLENLYLGSCGILHVNGESLQGFTGLQTLDLSSNRIKWLDDLSSPTLTFLDLSKCDIDSMNPNALNKLPSLITLRLSGNTQFAVNHGNLTSKALQTFEAGYCSLTTPGIHGFPNLTYANLRGNKIATLTERSFLRNKMLVELDISANEISYIHPQAFVGARQLTFINLSANSLTRSLPFNTFATNYNLRTLDLSMNRLQSVGNLSILMLQNLDLSQCNIKEIKNDSLKTLPWLTFLNLSYNPLEKIPDNIQSWYLKQLDLSYCRLTSITNETFMSMPEIESINLIGNRFTNPFKVEMFTYNEHLRSLQLANNPWVCDCSQELKLFWEFLVYYPAKIKQSEQNDIKCMSPNSVAGKSWIHACYGAWYPYDEPESSSFLTHYGTAILVLVIIAAGIFAVVGYIKHRIKMLVKEEQEEREREIGHIEDHTTVVFRQRENLDTAAVEMSDEEQRGRTESHLTQPPTYEEAMQMMRASREDVVSTDRVEDSAENERGTRPVKINRTERARACSAGSDDSVDEDSQSLNRYRGSEHSGDYSVGSDDSDEERGASNPLNRHK
jgi:Leucine-rich repeat (LRR) protein